MKPSAFLFGSLLLIAPALRAEPPPVAAAPVTAASADADRDWQALTATRQSAPDKPPEKMSPLEKAEWRENHLLRIVALGAVFIERYPADPRRWQLMIDLVMDDSLAPGFASAWGPPNPQGEVESAQLDEAALKRWLEQLEGWKAQLRAVPTLSAEVREYLAYDELTRFFTYQLPNGVKTWTVPDFPTDVVRAKVRAFGADFPNETRKGRSMLGNFIARARALAPEAETAEWRAFADSPNAGMAQLAQAQLRRAALLGQEIDFAFTAVDGREVDLKQLRGKVVLIDFWATWCAPCIKEIPNVLTAYQKYRDRGFEVVGIALENAGLKDDDTPEQRGAKVAKAKQVLTAFTATHGMAWPQYFDERHPKNDFAGKYDIRSIPAMFLVDRDGKIVSLEARGSQLEVELKRLLGGG